MSAPADSVVDAVAGEVAAEVDVAVVDVAVVGAGPAGAMAAFEAAHAGASVLLLEPWTREGISFALRSGRLAGMCAADLARTPDPARAQVYAAQVEATLGREVAAGSAYLAAFSRHPALFHRLIATPPGWAVFRRVVAGRTTLALVSRRPWVRAGLRLLG